MALTKTPVCDFGKKAEDFRLKSINNKLVSLNDIKGKNAFLPLISFRETNLLLIDFSLKSSAFFPKSQTGVLVRAIMYYKLINITLQQFYDL